MAPGRRQRCPSALTLGALIVVLVVARPGCFVAARRHGDGSNPAFGAFQGMSAGELAALKPDAEGAILGGDGRRYFPFDGLQVEGVLQLEAFTCYNGTVFGIQLPEIGEKKAVFHYLKRRPTPQLYPIEYYVDLMDDTKHILLFPPVEEFSDNYRIMYRLWAVDDQGKPTWRDGRLLEVTGTDHPCGAEYNEVEDQHDDGAVAGATVAAVK